MAAARLTKHQRWVLGRLTQLSGAGRRWVLATDCGSPSGLDHLFDKGYAETKTERGPRGGVHRYYRPAGPSTSPEFAKERGEMLPGAIDTRLIEARKRGEIVRVMCGKFEYRGVPGPVERDDETGVLELVIGQRRVPLRQITQVVS